MWGKIRCYKLLLSYGSSYCRARKLNFMTDAFKCEEAWSNRLKSPVLQKVNLENLFYEIDTKYNQTKKISAVDLDIFINSVNSNSYISEMEHFVHALRLTAEASNVFDSTHHAFIRTYLKHGEPNELMRVLNDRLNYGIFPDTFCYILLIDHFIKQEDFKNAANVAVLQMLQEEFPNELLKYLSLFSCYKYLQNPTKWKEETVAEAEDDGEEIKVRVKYIRNPFFDNHFDLKEPNSLIGKTLILLSNEISDDLKNEVKLLGYYLFKELPAAKELINRILQNKESITCTTADIIEKSLSEINEKADTEGNSQEDGPSMEIRKGIDLLKTENLLKQENLFDILESKIKYEASQSENLVQEQVKIYEEWNNHRETALREEIEKINKAKLLQEVEKKKKELAEKEQELFFFEREDEIDLKIENKRVRYPKKWLGKKKKKKDVKVNYIPPDVRKDRASV